MPSYMSKNLVIVESPAKAKTIKKYLGKDFEVLASYGHVRDLVPKDGAVDVEHGFEMKYRVIDKNEKHVKAIISALKDADELWLATDPDREGEAISWHLAELLQEKNALKGKPVKRVVFYEITQREVQNAIQHPREISDALVNAQQARRALDYLVGFNLSPLLWRKVQPGLSAGRVQSPALRLICEREEEIKAFVPREYWTLEARAEKDQQVFSAKLIELSGRKVEQFTLSNTVGALAAKNIVEKAAQGELLVAAVDKKQRRRNPAPPFTTSTLQQEAARKLHFAARRTMQVAQRLYEGVTIDGETVGLITYMRTDGVQMAGEAIAATRKLIGERFGDTYLPSSPRVYKTRAKNAQEAHEAIRPTSIANLPDKIKAHLTSDQYRLYRLIWMRTVASQMAAAILDATTVDIAAGDRFVFRATGQVIRFPGFMKLYIEGTDDAAEEQEGTLPALQEGEAVKRNELLPEQHFTQPPPRFTEASLVKTLEEYGIGRPSTYASIMNTLVQRKYVRLEKRTFYPEDVGRVVNDLLVNHFPKYVDYDFTAQLEEDLDAISRGEEQWRPVLHDFWEPFISLLKQKEQEVSKEDVTTEKTDKTCPECGKPLVIKLGRSGRFLACSGFPDCRHTEPLSGEEQEEPEVSEEKCDKCGAPMLIKSGRYGKFLACSAYPECKNIQPLVKPKALGITCPDCKEGELMEKKSRYGKIFYSCNRYPKCKYALWDQPIDEPCPTCGFPVIVEKVTKRFGTYRKCPKEGCDYKLVLVEPEKKTPAKKTPAKKAAAKKPAAKKAPAKTTQKKG